MTPHDPAALDLSAFQSDPDDDVPLQQVQALRRSDERNRAELEQQVAARTAELERSRDLLRATMDASIDMIHVFEAVHDGDGRIVDFHWTLNNHTSESRYGEVRGQSLLERNPGVIEEGIFAAFCQVTETGEPLQAERHYVHEQFDSWFLQSVVKLGDGVATTTKDIGDWKRAQAELLRLRDKVAQARQQEGERLSLLLQSMGEGVIGIAADHRCMFVNAAAAAMLGCRADQLVGRSAQDLLGEGQVLAAMTAGVSVRVEDEAFRGTDGTPVRVSCQVSPMVLGGNPAGAVVVFRQAQERRPPRDD